MNHEEEPEIEDDRTVFIGNLGYMTTQNTLRQFFSTVGSVRTVRIVRYPDGRPKGVAFVEFANKNEANKAVEKFNKTPIDGRICFLKIASAPKTPPEMRHGTRSKRMKAIPPPGLYNQMQYQMPVMHYYPSANDNDTQQQTTTSSLDNSTNQYQQYSSTSQYPTQPYNTQYPQYPPAYPQYPTYNTQAQSSPSAQTQTQQQQNQNQYQQTQTQPQTTITTQDTQQAQYQQTQSQQSTAQTNYYSNYQAYPPQQNPAYPTYPQAPYGYSYYPPQPQY